MSVGKRREVRGMEGGETHREGERGAISEVKCHMKTSYPSLEMACRPR